MKKIIFFFVSILFLSSTINAQKLNDSKIPAKVKESFAKQFPSTTAKWEKEDGNFEASFKKDGKACSALFTADGVMTESEISIALEELPKLAQQYIVKKFVGKKIKETAKITKADGTITYEINVAGKDELFDTKGNFLKEVKE